MRLVQNYKRGGFAGIGQLLSRYFLSLGNLLFAFFNPAFAIGIGLIYWIVTWQFQNLVSQYNISGGKIDDIGIGTTLSSLLPYMPLYVIQALIASISLVIMLGGLYGVLVWYVDAVERPGLRRTLAKFLIGTGHFLAHLTAMFALSLLVVMISNKVTPSIERSLTSVYADRDQQRPIVREVIEEGLQPLQRPAPNAAPAPSGPNKAQESKRSPVRELVGFVTYPTVMVLLGAIIGGAIWGLYWVVTGALWRMHSEEAFAALRLKGYKNFLRMKVERDSLTIYPLGVDKLPGVDDWMEPPRGQKAAGSTSGAKLVPAKSIDVRLIEAPIVIQSNAGWEG